MGSTPLAASGLGLIRTFVQMWLRMFMFSHSATLYPRKSLSLEHIFNKVY